jgi:Zn-dependent protease with chaperone function
MVRAHFTPENRAYATTRAVLGFVEPLWTILIGLFLLFSGFSAALRDAACRARRSPYARVLIYVLLFLVANFVLSLPLAFYQGFALEHRYGLSTESFGAWFLDQWKGMLVALVFLGVFPLVQLAYVPVRRFPRLWWLVLGLGALPVLLAGALLQPLVVEPVFNRFTPLEDKRLEARILEVAGKVGVPARHVLQVDRSRQTRKLSAYVSGFGPSQRIVLWDTTLREMKPDEILFVVGHEAAHYRLHHMWWGILAIWMLSFAIFGLSGVFLRRVVARWGGRWGFRELHDIASLPLFWVAFTLFTFLAQPGLGAFSRGMERDADTYGLEVTHLNDAAARAFIKLGAQNRSDPDPPPFVRLVQYDHPPLLERVRFALEYRPWERGRPNRLYRPRR